MRVSSKVLVGRLLTRSGDQAWDFAVPLTLLKLFPDQLRIAAFYYLLIRLTGVVCLPRLARLIDTRARPRIVQLSLILQAVGVLAGAAAILWLWLYHRTI